MEGILLRPYVSSGELHRELSLCRCRGVKGVCADPSSDRCQLFVTSPIVNNKH
ncbi:hypothetical protein J6590_043440 [Homalodisca vitripennis]|nr:hypothetical protein J6590_043440 [Homalodisca vitripennis]